MSIVTAYLVRMSNFTVQIGNAFEGGLQEFGDPND